MGADSELTRKDVAPTGRGGSGVQRAVGSRALPTDIPALRLANKMSSEKENKKYRNVCTGQSAWLSCKEK